MKATLEFDLHDIDDTRSHFRCIKALDMACVLWDIRNMRKELEALEDKGDMTSENVMQLIFEAFDNRNINIDEVL